MECALRRRQGLSLLYIPRGEVSWLVVDWRSETERLESDMVICLLACLLTFTAVLAEITLSTPLITAFRIELCFHLVPGKDYGTRFTIDVLSWVAGLLEVFDKMDGKVAEQRQVKTVEPDHWFLGSVG